MLLQLHHTDPTGEILRRLFAESLCTYEPLFTFSHQRILLLEQGMKPLSTLEFRKLKTQWEIKVLFVLGILPYYTTGDSHWWSFVSTVPKCTQAKLLFALVEISWPPNSSKLHKCKSELAVPCWHMSLTVAGGSTRGSLRYIPAQIILRLRDLDKVFFQCQGEHFYRATRG